MFIPEPKIRQPILPNRLAAPELLTPGRKPIAPIAIDWSQGITDKLEGYWLVNQSDSNDLLHDYSGFERHGVGSGSVEIKPDSRLGHAIDCDDYNTIRNFVCPIPDLDTFSIIVQCVIKAKSPSNGQSLVSLIDDSDLSTERVTLVADNVPDEWGIWDTNNSWLRSGVAQNIGVKTHVAIVFKGTEFRRIYVNSEKFEDLTILALPGTRTNLVIGAEKQTGISESWDGWIGDVALFSRALSDAEIVSHYENPFQFLKPHHPINLPINEADIPPVPVPNIRLENPRLFKPKQLPPGPLTIDWDHPFTWGLHAAFIFDNFRLEELTGRYELLYNSCQRTDLGLRQTGSQLCRWMPRAVPRGLGDAGYFPNAHGIIVADYRNHSTPDANCRILGMRYAGWDFRRGASDTSWVFKLGGNDQTLTPTADFIDGNHWQLVWRWHDTEDSRDFYAIDKDEIQTKNSSSGVWSVGSTSDEINFLSQRLTDTTGQNGAEGYMKYCFIYNVKPDYYPDEYRRMLKADPYQFIIPK